MEPRQQWRGNTRRRVGFCKTETSFNGAAPTMARKPRTHAGASGRSSASMEPRQQWRGNPPVPAAPRRPWLQWSRANNGAETHPAGRRLTLDLLHGAAPTMARKQTSTNAKISSMSRRFNGAAPTMARKRRAGNLSGGDTLQWSRANNGAETVQVSLS